MSKPRAMQTGDVFSKYDIHTLDVLVTNYLGISVRCYSKDVCEEVWLLQELCHIFFCGLAELISQNNFLSQELRK